jgi:hypothetical protein
MLCRIQRARYFVKLVSTYKTELRHNQEDHNLKMRGGENYFKIEAYCDMSTHSWITQESAAR